MKNVESTSPNSMGKSLENTDGQPPLVAVSEENLAALLRATTGFAEPEAQHPAKDAETAAPVTDADKVKVAPPPKPPASGPEPETGSPSETVESRLAMFAAAKEHRSAILRSRVAPPDLSLPGKADPIEKSAQRYENHSVSPLSGAAPLQAPLPDFNPLMPAPTVSIPTPSSSAIPDRNDNILQTRLVIGFVIGAVIAVAGVSIFLTRAHTSIAPKAQTPIVMPQSIPNNATTVQAALPIPPTAQPFAPPTPQRSPEQHNLAAPPSVANGTTNRPAAGLRVAAVNAQNTPNTTTVEVPRVNPTKVRTFVPPAIQRNSEQRTILDAPPALPNGAVTPPAIGLPSSLVAILPPSSRDGAAQQQVRVESSLQEAKLIRKVTPSYPQFAKSVGIQGTVRFTALIGKDGRMQNLKLISGPKQLVDAATAAVKQWVYRPTLLDGEPVEVITQIDINFTIQ